MTFFVTSGDGTRLACQVAGEGPPLVLVHGTGGAAARWGRLVPALAERYSVYAMERRGRGASGDAADYAIEREFDDVAAVVGGLPGPVNLLGHSFGAICALEAARRVPNLHRLILYEPPIVVEPVASLEDVERLEGLLAAGDRAGVLLTFMRDIVRMPANELELYTSSPAFPARVAAAHTLPREVRAQRAYRFRPELFAAVQTPACLLLGGNSPHYFHTATELIAAALPTSQVVVLPNQQHIAMDTAPEMFLAEVFSFLGTGR